MTAVKSKYWRTVFHALHLGKQKTGRVRLGRCLPTHLLAAGEDSAVGDEDTQRLRLSVSKQRAGLCFRKVEEQTEKVDLMLPEGKLIFPPKLQLHSNDIPTADKAI